MQDDTDSLRLITKFLNHPEEETLRSAVQDFRHSSTANEAYFLAISQIWALSAKAERLSVNPKARAAKSIQKELKTNSPSKKGTFWLINSAATILMVALGYWFYAQNTEPEFLVKKTHHQIDTLRLADGSLLTLAENTEIKYPKHFTAKERKVLLTKGQAFFNIVKNPNQPFKVFIHGGVLTVLGTSFNVQLYNYSIAVGVKTGKVKFSTHNHNGHAYLTTGQALSYHSVNKKMVRFNAINTDAWLTKELIFVDTPLEEVCRQLSSYYHVSIKLHHNGSSVKKLNATFKNQTLTEVLTVLHKIYRLKINVKSNQINLIAPSTNQ